MTTKSDFSRLRDQNIRTFEQLTIAITNEVALAPILLNTASLMQPSTEACYLFPVWWTFAQWISYLRCQPFEKFVI